MERHRTRKSKNLQKYLSAWLTLTKNRQENEESEVQKRIEESGADQVTAVYG